MDYKKVHGQKNYSLLISRINHMVKPF